MITLSTFLLEILDDESGENEFEEFEEFDEESALCFYFSRGYSYKEILLFLKNRHNHEISYRTLLRRLNNLGLFRRQNLKNDDHLNIAYERIKILSKDQVHMVDTVLFGIP